MIKFMVGWKDPNNPEQFDEHYKNVHAVLASKLPGLRGMNVSRSIHPTAPYRLVAELLFDSEEAWREAMASEAGTTASADAKNLGATAVGWISNIEEVVPTRS